MKRVELFEFEDFGWLPQVIRSGITNLLQVLHKMMGTPKVIADLLLKMDGIAPYSDIVDLGSGSGGPMLMVLDQLNGQLHGPPKNLLLTDRYPNPDIVSKVNGWGLEHVHYRKDPVDATQLEAAPRGLRTMVASFHHMPGDAAQAILNSSAKSGQPLLIYEIAQNKIPFLLWLLLLPLSLLILMIMAWFMTPFVRPLRPSQLIFTYLIPMIPIIYAWDGQASLMRTYAFKDIEHLIGQVPATSYRWEWGEAKKSNGKALGYYIMGIPEGQTKGDTLAGR